MVIMVKMVVAPNSVRWCQQTAVPEESARAMPSTTVGEQGARVEPSREATEVRQPRVAGVGVVELVELAELAWAELLARMVQAIILRAMGKAGMEGVGGRPQALVVQEVQEVVVAIGMTLLQDHQGKTAVLRVEVEVEELMVTLGL
jgi:hypothetical protein